MSEEPSARVAPASDLDYRLLIPFLAHATLTQTLILIIRITTSYRAIELGLPVLWLGIIATGFAVVPAVMALQVGRWIDRGNDAKATWIGAALVLVACIGFWLWPRSAMHLLAFTVLLGFGHMFAMAGHQMLAVRAGRVRSRESALGYYMVAASVGQGLGPFVVGWLGGAAALPPTERLFAIGLGAATVSLVVALLIRPDPATPKKYRSGDVVPIKDLLRLRGFPAVMVSSIVTITAALVCAFRTIMPRANDTSPITSVKRVRAFWTGCGCPSEFRMLWRSRELTVSATVTTSRLYSPESLPRRRSQESTGFPAASGDTVTAHPAMLGKLSGLRTTRLFTCAGS